MRCEEARQLFDAYLDGELSKPLATELAAHRVRCAQCRRALALLEVSGQIIASDNDPISLDADFSGRLLACMDTPKKRWPMRMRRAVYCVGPLAAAAAVIALAFLGMFDRGNGAGTHEIKGQKDTREPPEVELVTESTAEAETALPSDTADAERALELWINRTRRNSQAKRESVESLQKALDLTVGQWLDILEEAKDGSSAEDHYPGADATLDAGLDEADAIAPAADPAP